MQIDISSINKACIIIIISSSSSKLNLQTTEWYMSLNIRPDGKYTVSWFMSQENLRCGGRNPFCHTFPLPECILIGQS